jgi:GNAT superfamily N-acetyltransferase
MNIKEYNLWSKLTFRILTYRKNFDLINKNENFITEHVGTISKININEANPPIIVGEFAYSVWNIDFARKFDYDISNLLKKYRFEDSYAELLRLKKEEKFDFTEVKRIVFIHSLVIHPKFRKKGVAEELIESIYREYHEETTTIIALVKPIQDNDIDLEYFTKHNILRIRKDITDSDDYEDVKANVYYCLDELLLKTDKETNEYKLYALAARLGFTRIEDSYLFMFKPDTTLERMKEKFEDLNKLNKL